MKHITWNIHTLRIPSSNYSTQACIKVSYKGGKCILTRDRLQAFHFDNNGVALLYQPGFVSGQYSDSYFCAWNLPDPKPQHISVCISYRSTFMMLRVAWINVTATTTWLCDQIMACGQTPLWQGHSHAMPQMVQVGCLSVFFPGYVKYQGKLTCISIQFHFNHLTLQD